MKIGVVSDTHIPVNTPKVPEVLLNALKGCDLILHAGDLVELSVLDELKKASKKIEAVYGNMDPYPTRKRLSKKRVLTLEGKKICLMHGYGEPGNLIDILKKEFFGEKPDIIVFGHSHEPMNEYIDGVLFFNPGSVTDTVFSPYKSYGIIEIENGKIRSDIHKLT